MADPRPDAPPELLEQPGENGAARVALVGDWTLLALGQRFTEFGEALAGFAAGRETRWDLLGLSRLDTSGAMTLVQAWGRQLPQHLQCQPEHRALFTQILGRPAVLPRRKRVMLGPLSALGGAALRFVRHVLDATALAGRVLLDAVAIGRHPQRLPLREISASIYRAGAQALGITALVGFLVGITLSYLSARQLKTYGADIFIVDILGISILRELGPLLAAIIVAGRSGSSMTAQLGVMRVTQELDALSVMGISHSLRLVLPKVAGLALSMPLVVLWTSAVMLVGGMIAAQGQLGLSPLRFVQGLPAAVPVANLWLGWSKAVIFGALIALVACHFGLRIQPNTESLGRGVTQSVVTAITVVIVVDAIFAVLFSDIGI